MCLCICAILNVLILKDYRSKMILSTSLIPYLDCIYWVTATMTSTGYGDIKPLTQSEMIYSCFVAILGKIVIGYMLGTVAATLANDESLKVWYEQRVAVSVYKSRIFFS